MKTSVQILFRVGILVIFMSCYGAAYSQISSDAYVTVTGQLKDAKTGEKIIYAAFISIFPYVCRTILVI